jgi:hypothetical protein
MTGSAAPSGAGQPNHKVLMLKSFLRRRRVVGLDIGSGSIKALALEGRSTAMTS